MFLKNLGLQKRIKGRTTKEREDIYHVIEKKTQLDQNRLTVRMCDLLLRHKSNF